MEKQFTYKKIAIVSGKGGIGKTTLAINLGFLFNKEFNLNTVIIDGNLTTPHLSINLGIYNKHITLNHILKNEVKINDGIYEHPIGLKVIPASLELRDLEKIDIFKLPEKLDDLNYNILIDSAPGLGKEGIAAISSADEILFVTQPFTSAVVDIFRAKKVVEKLDKKILGVVVNARKNQKHELSDYEIEQFTELPVIESIPYDIEIEKAQIMKLPLPIHNSKAKANKSFYSLASKLTGIELEKENFLSKLLNLFRK